MEGVLLGAAATLAVRRGTIFNVQRASFHDGPGIRTTVFLKGCPLRCVWCHNPEGIRALPEVVFDAGRCIACRACSAACPRDGGPLPSGAVLGSDGCLACRRCVEACPAGAREVAGRLWSVDEVLAEVSRDRLSYETSGGGVTFSGGDPLFQPEFLLALLEACRRAELRTAVDTCGFAARSIVLAVAARSDLLLWDLKHAEPARHRALTGAPLQPILDNLAAAAASGVPIWLRIPVISGLNDDAETMGGLARVAARTPTVRRVSLLPYHRTGAGKLARLGRRDALAETRAPSSERMQALSRLFEASGLETRIGG